MTEETYRLPAPTVATTEGKEVALDGQLAPVPLDEIQDLVFMETMLRQYVDDWKEKLAACQDKIKEAMGGAEVGTVNGKVVFTWKRIDRLNETALRKAYPAMAEAYTHLVEVPKLDTDLLRVGQPDLFREFQVRQFKRID